MRHLLVAVSCVACCACTAHRVVVAKAATVCVDDAAVAAVAPDEATRTYQTAYDVCHSDPAFAARLYQQTADKADPQSDLYSRASLRLEALSSALARNPEAARTACDQAGKWIRPTEHVAVAVIEAPAQVAVVEVPQGPLPASWLPAVEAQAALCSAASSGGARAAVTAAGAEPSAVEEWTVAPPDSARPSTRSAREQSRAAGEGITREDRPETGASPLDCSRGDRRPTTTVAFTAFSDFAPPPLLAVPPPELPAPPLLAVPPPELPPPPLVAVARAPVRVVVRQDPGAELLGAVLSVFGSRPAVVYVRARHNPPPPRH